MRVTQTSNAIEVKLLQLQMMLPDIVRMMVAGEEYD